MPDNLLFSTDPAADIRTFLNQGKYSKVCVLTDDNTLKLCYPGVQTGLPKHEVVTVKSGEEFKNLDTCRRIWEAMTAQQLDRHAVLIVIGGGVLGDMGGFCAATYKRGIDFILVPTTLLSQVDASIGGKLGIDFNNFKNHIGVFQTPALTVLHSGFLKTLSQAEIRSGFAEIVKHTLISDASMWNIVKSRSLADQDWDTLIRHSVEFKASVVKEDPKEKGLRKILNAGHTIGHAIESHLLETGRKVMHGEAIAAGLICENFIATKKGLLSKEAQDEIADFILRVYGKLTLAIEDEDTVTQLTLQDKKNKGDKILCVLLEKAGKSRWDCEISKDKVKEALSFYRSIQM
jgi:3-dehydroquinate synthase